jgi:hypothetical protein
MFTILRHSAVAIAAAGLLASPSWAAAAVLYDNGALNGTLGAFTIGGDGGTDGVSNSFMLKAASTITGADFGVWTYPGDTVSTVDWGITTTANSFDGFLYGGTATVVSGATTLNPSGWPIGVDSISTGPVKLAAGVVYYLVLQNAVVANGDPVYWDESDGPSAASSSVLGNLQGYNRPNTTGSESFQILGPSGGNQVPEPAAWSLILVGFAGLGATLRGARTLRSAGF